MRMSIWPCIDGIEVAVTTATLCCTHATRERASIARDLLYGTVSAFCLLRRVCARTAHRKLVFRVSYARASRGVGLSAF